MFKLNFSFSSSKFLCTFNSSRMGSNDGGVFNFIKWMPEWTEKKKKRIGKNSNIKYGQLGSRPREHRTLLIHCPIILINEWSFKQAHLSLNSLANHVLNSYKHKNQIITLKKLLYESHLKYMENQKKLQKLWVKPKDFKFSRD